MKFKKDFFKNYLNHAPLPLAIERSMECEILSKKNFARPILDIGCGDGIFAHNLFAEKIDLGIDPNAKELESARSYDGYSEVIECFGDKIPKETGIFKTIFSNSVMEHIPEIDGVLIEAKRLLSDDGVMYLTLPTQLFDKYNLVNQVFLGLKLDKVVQRYSEFFNKFWRHYHYYTVADWKKLFERYGFVVSEQIEYGTKATCVLNDVMAPFSLLSLVAKKTQNRWFLFPALRKKLSILLAKLFAKYALPGDVVPGMGGLVFFELRKSAA